MTPHRTAQILRVDGTTETVSYPAHRFLWDLEIALEANGFDTVNLHDGRVMLVDDTGFLDRKPRNEAATRLYLARCKPGTDHYIAGDVAIVEDAP